MRRPKLDLAKEYQALGRKLKQTETRMSEIKKQVIDKGGMIKCPSGTLAIEYAERRSAPNIEALTQSGYIEIFEKQGLIRKVQVQFLRLLKKSA